MVLLTLPISVSMVIVIVLSWLVSIGFYFAFHRILSKEISGETRKMGEMVATRIGVVHAVVLGMMFTSVREEYNEMLVATENEASSLVRLHQALDRQAGEKTAETRKKLLQYARFVVEDEWPALREVRVRPEINALVGREVLDSVWEDLEKVDYQPGYLNLRELLDQVETFRAQRLFDQRGQMLPFFWFIALFGWLATLITFFIYPPSFKRCFLACLYSGLVASVLLGILVLSHPYSLAAGVSPDVFEWLLGI